MQDRLAATMTVLIEALQLVKVALAASLSSLGHPALQLPLSELAPPFPQQTS